MDQDIQKIINEVRLLDKLCDIVRFVDPIRKTVIYTGDDAKSEMALRCFDFWGNSKVCDNCISIRSYYDNETYVKIEYTEDRTYMITALPHQLADRRVVIEMFKDVTTSMFLSADGSQPARTSEIRSMIDKMNAMTMRDPLTGIFNRRYISEKMPVDLINTALSGQNLSIIMADIDHFKNINDTYGHLAGDCALKRFVELLSGCIKRGSAWLARYGGEEFMICLPGADTGKARDIAEKMRQSVERAQISCGDMRLQLTCSFGVFSTGSGHDYNVEQMIAGADEKLYLAKRNGRNRVES